MVKRRIVGTAVTAPCVHPAPSRSPKLASAAAVARAASLFRAMGDPARLRLLDLLGRGELCVSEIAATSSEGLSTVSQRLRVLRQEGLVVRRRDGKHLHYALADSHVHEILESALAHAVEPRLK